MPGDSWIIFFQESKDYSRIGCLERFWHIIMFRVLLPNIPKGWSILPQRQGTTICSPVLRVGLRGQALYSYFWFEENGPKIFLEATEKRDNFHGKRQLFSFTFSRFGILHMASKKHHSKDMFPETHWNLKLFEDSQKKGGSKRVSEFHYQLFFSIFNSKLRCWKKTTILLYSHMIHI